MSEQVLLDNDIALKIAAYSLVQQLLHTTTVKTVPPSMLGVGKFVIIRKIIRGNSVINIEAAKDAFEELASAVNWIEPSDDEAMLAAQFEAEAFQDGFELDIGESLLVAILLSRSCPLLITGDKRAIKAIAKSKVEIPEQRLCCLEQLVAHITAVFGLDEVRTNICAEPKVDRAITTCFSCSKPVADSCDVAAGLGSYINDVARSAPDMLITNEQLVAFLASTTA